MNHRIVQTLLGFLLIPALQSCSDLGAPYIPPRLVLGKSIDLVELGDSQETVIQKLGMPSQGGVADGITKAWFVAVYDHAPHTGISIWYIDMSTFGQEMKPGPTDEISLDSTYTGRTEEDIGIGSTIEHVRATYGPPKSTRIHKFPIGLTITKDDYCFGRVQWGFDYFDGILKAMWMGSFYRTSLDTLCD